MNDFIIAKEKNNVDKDRGYLLSFVYGKSKGCKLHLHEYYELFLILKGCITHYVNEEKQTLSEGALALIRPKDIHTQICKNENTSFVNLAFTKQIALSAFDYLFNTSVQQKLLDSKMPTVVYLSAANKQRILDRLNELNALKRDDIATSNVLIRSILAEILPILTTNLSEYENNSIPLWLKELTYKMSLPENFTLGIDRMVELSKKTREHLSRLVKKHYNVTLSDFINDLKINYATNLLITTNMPIIDVCFTCGFQNVSHFYSVFKQKNKLTPKEFRNEHLMQINI
ncbi:MAG: helix-turn-helix domain-containing protein [Clostridia bacterium]|nr:helix-turn-helix domain-containing protein [Clostridia bacterium]